MKYFVILFLLFSSLSTLGQDICCRTFNIYIGKVKEITDVVSNSYGQSQIRTTTFDESGRILSQSSGDFKYTYYWCADSTEIECVLSEMDKDAVVNKAYVYVNTYSDSELDYEIGDVSYHIDFNANRSINKSKIKQNKNILETQYVYNDGNNLYPYKVVQKSGSQTMVTYISVKKVDEYNNLLEFSQTSNGVTLTTQRTITYYK